MVGPHGAPTCFCFQAHLFLLLSQRLPSTGGCSPVLARAEVWNASLFLGPRCGREAWGGSAGRPEGRGAGRQVVSAGSRVAAVLVLLSWAVSWLWAVPTGGRPGAVTWIMCTPVHMSQHRRGLTASPLQTTSRCAGWRGEAGRPDSGRQHRVLAVPREVLPSLVLSPWGVGAPHGR